MTKAKVIMANALFCHSERSEESSMDASLRLRSVQHDRGRSNVIPSEARNPVWKCKGVQQGGDGEPHPLVPLLQKERDVSASPKQGEVNPARGCFTALMLRSA